MMKSFTKNMNFNYVTFLFLVLLLSISLAACGSTTVEDLNNIINPPDNSVDSVSSYTISGMGYTNTVTFQITTTLSVSESGLAGAFLVNDANSRTDFQSTSINDISVSNNSATISGDIAIKEWDDSLTPGYTYEVTITDGDPAADELVLSIYNPDGTLYLEISTALDDITSTFTITEI